MSEKRFTFGVVSQNDVEIKDNGEPMNIGEVVDKLNEQQATINELKEELILEQDFASRWQRESEMLAEENEQLKKRVDKLKVIMAEFGATLLMNGFDIEIDDKDLMEMINNE